MLSGSQGLIEGQIKEWVRQNVCAISKEHGRCKKIVIRHLTVNKTPDADVHSINISTDPAYEGTELADKVVLDIAEAAQRDANDYKAGVQTYAAYAYYTVGDKYVPRKLFRVGAEEDFDPESGPSEPATEKGLLAQLMRHNEINAKNSLVGMGYILQTLQREVQEQRNMNREFMRQQIDMTLLLQDVMNDASKRRIDEKKTELEMSTIEGVFEHLKIVLPIIVNRIAGKDVIPTKMDRELYLLSAFLENLSPDQQETLKGMLSPQQITMLADLIGLYEIKKAKLAGEKPPTQGDSESQEKKTNGSPPAAPFKDKLLTLFEKRRTLVGKDTRLEIDDDVTRRIERRAASIQGRLANVGNTLEDKKGD